MKSKKLIAIISLLIIGLGLVGYGAWGLWQRYSATHQQNVTIPSEIVTHSTDTPDETVPKDACDNYQVPATQPRKIEINAINVDGCIQRVGIDQNNAIAVPTNIHLAGWYTSSVLPGDAGNSIIDGHVLGRYDDAIFAHLAKLNQGDIIRIQFGDESWKEFKVVEVKSYTIAQAAVELNKQLDGVSNQLTLITCTGTYISQSKTYDQRAIVRAKLVL